MSPGEVSAMTAKARAYQRGQNAGVRFPGRNGFRVERQKRGQKSKAYLLYKEMGFSSPEELEAAYQTAHLHLDELRTNLKSVETAIAEKKELQRHVLNYYKTKDIREGLKA